ncbi:DUF6418 domain-containing protein [Bradyrhizobium sp. 164]|uniref:DUF6418 domain-containing protein n=1 Tax=Bradyrhizobium sp. 164 TaxID=2782637 RepID=UPI001FFB54E1|nr:DUF6418 domain-containing protein [Bradyrhizobium sp. 164]MCK1594674.1 hypothetical protein [Bradyrhizobium sp. 164]
MGWKLLADCAIQRMIYGARVISLWDSELWTLLSALAVCLVLLAMVRIAINKLGLFMLSFFVFFSLAWRLLSVLYIDLAGPVFSEQLERDIGTGWAALPLAGSQGLVIAALMYSFRKKRLAALTSGPTLADILPAGRPTPSDLAHWVIGLFAVALWVELLIRGPIPIFAAMERYDYSAQYGGPLHHRLIEWGPMLAFQLGVFFAAPSSRGREFDLRFAVLFGIFILYLFVVGHRFSSFFSYSSFFILPVGAVLLANTTAAFDYAKIFRAARLPIAVVAVLILGALIYSYAIVRGFERDQLLFKLSQRIFVQQGEMWWITYERVFLRADWSPGQTFYKLFVNPLDPNRNSTMQWLMELALPLDRAHFILGKGSAYTGGWPEVLFELGGPVEGVALVALSAILFSEFMFLLTRCIVQERYATCFFLTPLLYAFSLYVVTGMVNSFIQFTFLVKLMTAIFVFVAEEKWRSSLSGPLISCESLAAGEGGKRLE